MPIPDNLSESIYQSAKESAFSQLQQWIIDGTLLPGEKLNDTELAEALGVSRTPIRESLQLLEAGGLVRMYPNKATEVTEVNKALISDILPPLAALQALAVEICIPQITDETIILLEETNKRFEAAIASQKAYSAIKIDEEFHQVIIDAANNPYIISLVASLQAHVRRLFFHNSIVLTERSIADHKALIQTMKDRDSKKASIIMRDNWLGAIEGVQK